MEHETIVTFDRKGGEVWSWFEGRIASLRTGRATPALVEHILVDAYGSKQSLRAIATISIPQPQTMQIQPWDKSLIPEIERAIVASSLGVNPVSETGMIILRMPALTEERRKELAKILGTYTEEARIRLRRERDEAWKKIQSLEQKGTLSEDEKFRLKDTLQKKLDEWKEKIEEGSARKEKEILTI